MKKTRLPGIVRVKRFKTTVSTQNAARRLAEKGAPAWSVVWADRQTGGRGRMDRRWSSGVGGLYFSLILRPKLKPERLAALSLRAGRICAGALRKVSGLAVRIKPPNDVLARPKGSRGPYKKICGILIEASGRPLTTCGGGTSSRKRSVGCAPFVEWVIIGIGVNVSNRIPPSLPHAASLAGLSGAAFTEEEVLKAVLRPLRAELKSF